LVLSRSRIWCWCCCSVDSLDSFSPNYTREANRTVRKTTHAIANQ
jgi:hypothetical protein